MLLGGTVRTLCAVFGLASGFVITGRLYPKSIKCLLGIDVAFYSFARQLCQRHKGEWLQKFHGLGSPFSRWRSFVARPGQPASFWASMNDSVACRASAASSVFLIFLKPLLCLLPVILAVSSSNHIHQLLLGIDKVLHTFAGQLRQNLRLIRLPGLGCFHPGIRLLSRRSSKTPAACGQMSPRYAAAGQSAHARRAARRYVLSRPPSEFHAA